jgi:O-antigen ligase
LLEGLILYFLMINVVRTLSTLKRVMWTLLLACSLLGGLSVYQEMTRTYENNYGGLAQRRDDLDISEVDFDEFGGSRRAGGPVGTENRYAQVLIVILPLALGLFYIEPRRKFKLFAVAAAGLILGGMVLTFSRGAFVTLVLLLVIIVFLRYIRPSQALFAAGLTVLIIVVSLPEYIDRVNTVTGVSNLASANDDTRELDGSLRGRFAENIAALRVFIEHPVLGVGPGQFPKFYSAKYGNEVGTKRLRSSRRAHSLYLELAAETGAIGLTAFLAIAVTTGYRLWQERRRWLRTRPDLATIATAFVLAIIAYFGTATFLHLSYQRYYWFLLALAGAAIRICRNESVPTIPAEVEEEEYYVAKHVPERAA